MAKEGHKSHISSREANLRGWSRVPPQDVRAETYSMGKEVGTEFMDNSYMTLTCSDNSCDTAGTTTTGTTWYGDGSISYYPYQTWVGDWHIEDYLPFTPNDVCPTVTIREIIKEKVVTKEVEQRTLFKVFVVDPRKSGKILSEKAVIAENENQAMLKAGVVQVCADNGLELEQADVYCQLIGTFIRPRKDTQRVKVVKTDEED